MSSYRARMRKKSKKRSQKQLPNAQPITKSQSAPQNIVSRIEWPGDIEDKYIEDVRNRLNAIEQMSVDDDMIRAFLAANDKNQRHTVEHLKQTIEWRKGRQMFWNNYHSLNERAEFLRQIRCVGKGIGSTYGRTKKGRLVFYERIGQNFNMSLFAEFSCTEFIDHVIVWCENLLNAANANAGKTVHCITEIPYYLDEEPPPKKQEEKKEEEEEEEEEEDNNTVDDDDDDDPKTENMDMNVPEFANQSRNSNAMEFGYETKRKFSDFTVVEESNKCKYCDVVGIIDWKGVNVEMFLKNIDLVLATESLLSTHYPHLINCLYHVNMPLDFDKIQSVITKQCSAQILSKSIFLESSDTKQKRQDFMKKYGKPSIKRSRARQRNNKKKEEESEPSTDIGDFDPFASAELLAQIEASNLPKIYGGDVEEAQVFTFVDPIYRDLVGVSAEPTPSGFEQYIDDAEKEEYKLWTSHPLRSAERHTERISVRRGEHYKWQYMAEYDKAIYFGVVFEADGFRGKSIKIIVRKEEEVKCGYCAQFGDYIVLKDGNLIFQFRNLKGAKRLNLKYKIEHNVFPKHFVNKYLPDYNAEERLLQTNTLNVGGKNRRSKAAKTWSEYSGSTALSTSPPPVDSNLSSLSVHPQKNTTKKIMAKSARSRKSTKKRISKKAKKQNRQKSSES